MKFRPHYARRLCLIGAIIVVLISFWTVLFKKSDPARPSSYYDHVGGYLVIVYGGVLESLTFDRSSSIEETALVLLANRQSNLRGDALHLNKLTIYYNNSYDDWWEYRPESPEIILLMCGELSVRGGKTGYAAIVNTGRHKLLSEQEAEAARQSLRQLPNTWFEPKRNDQSGP